MPTEPTPDRPILHARERSQLRFAFFLQVAAGLLLIAVVIIRLVHRHVDLITVMCALGALGVLSFAAFTRSQLQR